MLFLEEKSTKFVGSVLALSVMAMSCVMAISAAVMPAMTVSNGTTQEKQIAGLQNGNAVQQPGKGAATEESNQAQPPKMVVTAQNATVNINAQEDAVMSAPAAPVTNSPNASEADVWLMARVIHAEGRGEPLEGQVAIGAVLLNRVRDGRFPNSLAEVIYQSGAFCTVRDGQISLPPNDTAVKAARMAARGWDPSGGALYFYNPARTTSHWIYSRPVINRIGQHVFAA